MVFILPEEAMVKDHGISVMEGDVVETGETSQILGQSLRHTKAVSFVIILKEHADKEQAEKAACVIFEKPTLKAANHIKPLYISGCLVGCSSTVCW